VQKNALTVAMSDPLLFTLVQDLEFQTGYRIKQVVATGAINLKGIKSRAIRHTDYRIADGNPDYAFVHVNLVIREGRSIEIQKEAARRVMAVLKDTFGHRFDNGYLSLSVDIKEMREGIALTDHNIPADPA